MDIHAVQWLVEHGADIEAKDIVIFLVFLIYLVKQTALIAISHISSTESRYHNCLACAQYLVDVGATIVFLVVLLIILE